MIKFAQILYLYGLVLVPFLILFYVLMVKRKKNALKVFADGSLLNRLTNSFSKSRPGWKFTLVIISYILIILALSRPQIGSKVVKAEKKGVDLMIVLDVSNSMLCEDIQPSRLQRSKQAISKLIDKLDNDRLGIIVFAGKAYIQLPITSDYTAAKMFLETINTDIMPEQGTAIGNAIELATESFDSEKEKGKIKNNKAIIIITDGENHEDNAVEEAEKAHAKGIKVSTIGMGLPDGAPIPILNGGLKVGYKKDRENNTIISKLDEPMLQKIANAGKGVYIRANNSNAGLQSIFEEISKLDKVEFDSKTFSDYEDRFQYFVGIALFLLIMDLLILNRKSKYFSKINLFGTKK